MEDFVVDHQMLFVQVGIILMVRNVQFNQLPDALLAINLLTEIVLHKQILFVQIKGFGMDLLVFNKPKLFVQVDLDSMLVFVLPKLQVHVHMDTILLDHPVFHKHLCLVLTEDFGMVKIVLLLLRELVQADIILMDLNV
jgi:hypothetical protein